MKNKYMTVKAAKEMMMDCVNRGCLGEGDERAVLSLLHALDVRTRALDGLVGPAAAVLDEMSGLLEAGTLRGAEEREAHCNAACDDLAMQIGKADTALSNPEDVR